MCLCGLLFYVVCLCGLLFYVVCLCGLLFYVVCLCGLLFYVVCLCGLLFYVVCLQDKEMMQPFLIPLVIIGAKYDVFQVPTVFTSVGTTRSTTKYKWLG